MKHYFEVTYPRRLADLKKELSIIVEKFHSITDLSDVEKEKILIKQFTDKISLFAENTKLHIHSLKTAIPGYEHMVTPEYLLDYFGGVKTSLGVFFSICNKHLYNKKEE